MQRVLQRRRERSAWRGGLQEDEAAYGGGYFPNMHAWSRADLIRQGFSTMIVAKCHTCSFELDYRAVELDMKNERERLLWDAIWISGC